MKKKLVFSGILAIALVLTTGTFAFSYSNQKGATIDGGTLADGAWATYNTPVSQPDWQSVVPGSEYLSEILLPNAAGDETNIPDQTPASGEHWAKVADISSNDTSAYLSSTVTNSFRRDLYNLADHQQFDESVVKKITSVTVYFRFSGSAVGIDRYGYARPVIKIAGVVSEGTEESQLGSSYATKSYTWQGNPATGKLWTWDEVDTLQAGVSVKGDNPRYPVYVTQVYVAVNYEKKITQNEVPLGDLFNITPDPEYTGDLQVRIYITNTAALIKAYSYLNLELYMAHSLESQRPPTIQVLSLENGVAAFNIEGGSASTYAVEVYGGAYRLVSADSADWATGWSVIPEFYCEVSQR